jgi:hypothetical protein
MKKYKVVKITNTCEGCPSQWEGTLSDGRMIYVRYRWGFLSVRVSDQPTQHVSDAVGGNVIFEEPYGDDLSGVMSFTELVQLTDHIIEWPTK